MTGWFAPAAACSVRHRGLARPCVSGSPGLPLMPRTLDLALDFALRNRLPQVHIQPERDGEERPSHSRVDDPDVPYILNAGTLAESLSRPAACVVILRNSPDHGQAEHA